MVPDLQERIMEKISGRDLIGQVTIDSSSHRYSTL